MNIPLRHSPHPARSGCPRIELLRRFFHEHGEALAQAADLLGGPAAEGRARQLAEAAGRTPRLPLVLVREIEVLHRLLSLEDVADPDGVEASYFAAIDPGSREVEDICLLTDELGRLLDALDRLADEAVVPTPVRHDRPRAA